MSKRQSRPLNLLPGVLFAPADGVAYCKEDTKRVFSQQPIEGPLLPFTYLVPSRSSTLKPPVLRYGWRIGHTKLMEIIRTHFPSAIQMRRGPDLFGHEFDEEYINSLPDEEFSKVQLNTMETMYGDELVSQLCAYVGLSPDSEDLFYIQPLHDSEGRVEVGLTVGSNYVGVLDEPHYSKLKVIVSPNEDAKWYLDYARWRWRYVASKTKTKAKRTPSETT